MDWNRIRTVILDVDGTLYEQRVVRVRMLLKMLGYFMLHPHRLWDGYCLFRYRRLREELADSSTEGVEEGQFRILSELTGAPVERIRSVVDRWMHVEPLPFLKASKYPGVDEFVGLLSERGIDVAFFSDYPLARKLDAMGLPGIHAFCSTDPRIDVLKPSPKGLKLIMETFGREPQECLMIGDRYERDGRCAESLGMPYLIIGKGDAGFYPELCRRLTAV